MPYRSWITAFALGLIALSSPEKSHGQQKNDGSYDEFYGLNFPTFQMGEKLDERPSIDRPCPEGEDDRSSDLCAQWKAADAAQVSAEYTRKTYTLGIWAVAIGALTLGAAGAAAWYAKIAGKAATETVHVTRNIGGNQLRPWMLPLQVKFTKLTDSIIEDGSFAVNALGIHILWKNFGQSPAVNAIFCLELRAVPANGRIENFDVDLTLGGGTIGPGASAITVNRLIPQEKLSGFIARELDIIAYSKVVYSSAIDDVTFRSEATFRCKYDGTQSDEGDSREKPRYITSMHEGQNKIN